MPRSLSQSNSSRGRILRPQRNTHLPHQLLRVPLPTSRVLKKSASFVLASLRGSTLSKRFSEAGNTGGAFPFAKTHCKGERPHEVRYVPPRLFARCGLARDKARPGRARVGRVRSLAILSTLRTCVPVEPVMRTVGVSRTKIVFRLPTRSPVEGI